MSEREHLGGDDEMDIWKGLIKGRAVVSYEHKRPEDGGWNSDKAREVLQVCKRYAGPAFLVTWI